MARCRRLGLVIDPRRVEVENSGSRRDSTALVSGARPLRPEAVHHGAVKVGVHMEI